MNIADSRTFVISETILGENPIVRANRIDTLVLHTPTTYQANFLLLPFHPPR